jgi:hypothetical protein
MTPQLMLDAITKVKRRALWFPILTILKSFGIQVHFHQGTALQFTMIFGEIYVLNIWYINISILTGVSLKNCKYSYSAF